MPEVNIFGIGNSSVEVQTVQDGAAKSVKVTRDLDNFQLPWKRQQWTTFRSFLRKSDFSEFIADLVSFLVGKRGIYFVEKLCKKQTLFTSALYHIYLKYKLTSTCVKCTVSPNVEGDISPTPTLQI